MRAQLGLAATLLLWTLSCVANPSAVDDDAPRVFFQTGAAEQDTRSYTAGAWWNWNWERDYALGRATGYTEFAVGRWSSPDDAGGDRWVTQIGITPVIRLQPYGAYQNWFVEAGIGANAIFPIYRNGEKRFSTEFNFGDHLAIGRKLDGGKQEVALRIQHFSNAGLRSPNPGENFLQIRYASRF